MSRPRYFLGVVRGGHLHPYNVRPPGSVPGRRRSDAGAEEGPLRWVYRHRRGARGRSIRRSSAEGWCGQAIGGLGLILRFLSSDITGLAGNRRLLTRLETVVWRVVYLVHCRLAVFYVGCVRLWMEFLPPVRAIFSLVYQRGTFLLK